MSTITLDQMSDKLLTLDQVHTILGKTEPLVTTHISSESKVKFHLTPDWALGLDSVDGVTPIGVTMRINGVESQMTKDAVLQAGANFGLPASYMSKRLPASYTETLLNYHYNGGMADSEYQVLTINGNIGAFTRPTLVPFSNLQLLESAVEGIHERHGANTPIFADYKIHNTLAQTDVRLILPAEEREITGTNMSDVPQGAQDTWFAGLHLMNSLIGKKQTTLEAYLFRWWCTNGATTLMNDVGTWSRRVDGQQDDVYAWARDSVDEILGGLEHRFEEVQALTTLNVAGNTADVLRQIFTEYDVPVSQRNQIMANMLESDDGLTMYTIMNTITELANDSELSPQRADRLMRIGGAIPTTTFDTIKAQVWREGHSADTTATNPYEIAAL